MQIKTFLCALFCLLSGGSVWAQVAELRGNLVSVSTTEASSITTSQWYVMKSRGRNAHVYETASGGLNMSGNDINGSDAADVCGHLVRFVGTGSANAYYIQTGYGHYFKALINGLGAGSGGGNNGVDATPSVVYTSAVIASTAGHFSFVDANGVVLDANSGGGTLAGWGTSRPTSTGGNNDWALYAVTLTKDESGSVVIVPDATETTTITSGSDYCIQNVGCGKFLSLQTSYTESNSVNATPLTASPTAFTLTQSGSSWSIKSGSSYVGFSTSNNWNTKNFTSEQNVWTIEATETIGQYYIKSAKGYLKYDGSNNYAYTNGAKTDACIWTITLAPQTVSTFTEGKYYRIRNYFQETRFITSNGGAIYAYEGTGEKYDQIWMAKKSGANWQLMCVLDGQYIRNTKKDVAYATGATGSALVITAKGTSDDGRPYVMIAPSSATNAYFNNSKAAQAFQIVSWSDINDNSSYWYIEQVPLTAADVAAIEQIRAQKAHVAEILGNVDAYAATLATYFQDNACTQLKSAYANKSAEALRSELSGKLPAELVEMVVNVRNDKWDADATKSGYIKRFRIADYEAYSDPGEWRKITNVGPFGRLSNPTGVTVQKGQLLYVMVESAPKDADAQFSLLIAEDTNSWLSQQTALNPGLNIILAKCSGEAFVGYNITNTARRYDEYAPITVHIEGGEATGMWDLHRKMTNADWDYLCQNMFTSRFLHVKGESTMLCTLTDNVRGAANPEGIMKIWDFIFDTEERLVGNDGQWDGRYRPVICPRHSYQGNPNWGGNHGTNHPNISKNYLFNFEQMVNNVGNLWEIYHEEAHAHQYPINIAATTESSNNGYALMVNYEFGSYSSRNAGIETLITFKNNGWGWVDILRGGEGTSRTEGFQYYDDALWLQCHLFYQLYLYFHVQGHMPDFWPRVADRMRELTQAGGGIKYGRSVENPGYYYNDYLLFAKVCAEVSQTDLYEFFDTWGFFGYYDEVKVGNDFTKGTAFKEKDNDAAGVRFVGDYGSYYLRMPVRGNEEDEAYLATLKAEMQAMPKKAPGIMFIDDHNRILNVSDSCFIAREDIYPSRVGTPMGNYNKGARLSGDYGMFTDYRADNGGSGIRFTQSGTSSTSATLQGTGIVGVKVYDETGRILRIYNTKSFTLDSTVASKVKSGDYKVIVCLGDDTQLPLNSKDFDMNLDGSYTIADVALLAKALNITTGTYTVDNVSTLRDRVLEK